MSMLFSRVSPELLVFGQAWAVAVRQQGTPHLFKIFAISRVLKGIPGLISICRWLTGCVYWGNLWTEFFVGAAPYWRIS